MPAQTHIPSEFQTAGITTPEEAAEYLADIVGVASLLRMQSHIAWAESEGRTADAEFYEAVLEIQRAWYPPLNG